ncbi:MAG: cysteine synthase family protein [Flavobacteriales bacterium]|nr:cysteine synthase family protein [Flavobacteriales bacterium]
MTLPLETPKQSPAMNKIAELEHYVGNTPLIEIRSLNPNKNVRVLAKLEWHQFGGSVKARAAYNIIRTALENGDLYEGKSLLDATSGNTGIAYAIFCAVAGIDLTLCVPENCSEERKQILKALGANVVYTSPFETTDGAQRVAREMVASDPSAYFYADQYANDANWLAHYHGTAVELWNQTREQITHFVSGLGTTGTFTGTGTRLLEFNPNIELIGLQPDSALHGMEGWKHLETAHIPGIYNDKLAHRFLEVDTMEAYDMIQQVARHEGLLISPSSAANLVGALKVAENLDTGTVVTVFPDDASKYGALTSQLFNL